MSCGGNCSGACAAPAAPRAPAGPTTQDGLDALVAHAVAKAGFARRKYGPVIDRVALEAMLGDAEVVRFPTRLRFDGELMAGEFAHAMASGEKQSLTYTVWVHPHLAANEELLVRAVAYNLVRVNYGDIATSDAAEAFGAELLGIDREEYYAALCALADSLA